jgi:N-methylhydantoinase A
MKLDMGKALEAIKEKIAQPLGMSVMEAASGIYRIANAHMSDLIRKATVEKGHDPRDFVLFAFGGAAPVHASGYAAELGIREVIVPLTASVHGATGLVSSDVTYEYGKSDHLLVPADAKTVNANFSVLVDRAYRDLASAGFPREQSRIRKSLEMRYRYQVHELTVPVADGPEEITADQLEAIYSLFDELYERSYGRGSGYRQAGKEILTFRVTATGELKKTEIRQHAYEKASAEGARKEKREVYFLKEEDSLPTPVYDFERMRPGHEVVGPAVIETPVTTIVVNPKDSAVIDEFYNVRLAVGL